MKLSRYGYNTLVLVWIIPVMLLDFIGNTFATGLESDIYYWKSMADLVVAALATYFVVTGKSASSQVETTDDKGETVISLGSIWAIEPYYCLLLMVYAGVSWFGLHIANKNSTGFASLASLIWSFMSLAIALLSFLQFWNLKSQAVKAKAAELKKSMVQQ